MAIVEEKKEVSLTIFAKNENLLRKHFFLLKVKDVLGLDNYFIKERKVFEKNKTVTTEKMLNVLATGLIKVVVDDESDVFIVEMEDVTIKELKNQSMNEDTTLHY